MKINALLDVNVVAHEAGDEVNVLLELLAPPAVADTARPQASLQVVLDRSGSMAGEPLEGAKKALVALVRRLEPTDNFGLVTFDDSAQVVVAAGPLTDKEEVVELIRSIDAGAGTDLSAGYLRGLRDLRRVATAGGTLLVVSDGHVNGGLQDLDDFASIAAKAHGAGIVTSTLGYGQGYDETLLSALARSGSGNHVFADSPDAAGAAIACEVDGLLNKVVQAVSLTLQREPSVEFITVCNDLPVQVIDDYSAMIELGDLYGNESRRVLLKFEVPAMAALGLAKIATLELAYVELPGLVEHVVVLPINVNVVPGDEAAGRVKHPTVHSEVLFQQAQAIKKQASEAFERGDSQCGLRLLGETQARLSESLQVAPDDLTDEIRGELDAVERMRALTHEVGSSYMSKLSRESYHRGNRQRGRTTARLEDEAED
jgi:Ca-activated chloride channel homolog